MPNPLPLRLARFGGRGTKPGITDNPKPDTRVLCVDWPDVRYGSFADNRARPSAVCFTS